MKTVAVLLLFASVAVNAQRIRSGEHLEKLFARTSCEYQLVEPLNALLYDNYSTWTEVCDGSQPFSINCRDPMLLTCMAMAYSSDTCSTYMYWIDAFVAGGQKFTCNYGYENITDVHENQGGHSCTFNEQNSDLSSSVDDIRVLLKSPKLIACNDVTWYMNATLTVLKRCENRSMMNLVKDFFEKVLDFSPCPHAPIGAGAGATSVINAMVLIAAAMFSSAILFSA